MSVKNLSCRVGLALAAVGLLGVTAASALDRSDFSDSAARRVRVETTTMSLTDDEATRIQRANDLALQHELVRAHLKTLDVAFDKDATLAAIESAAQWGDIDQASIDAAVAQVPVPEVANKVGDVLHDYAAWLVAASSNDPAQPLPPFEQVPTDDVHAMSAGGTVVVPGTVPNTITPHLGGTCLSCPSYNFGPYTPTTSYQLHSSSTSSGTDCNTYAFNVTPGLTYEWTFCAGGGTASYDTYLYLRNMSGCGLLTSNDDSCGLQSRIQYTIPAGVTQVHLSVNSYGNFYFGSYTLAYRQVPSVTCYSCASPNPTLRTPGITCASLTGSNASCVHDYYQFSLTGGQTYQFSLVPLGCPSSTVACAGSATYDSYLNLYNSGCGLVAVNDDACGLQSWMRYTAPSSGIYRLDVTGFASQTGNYTLAYIQEGCGTDRSAPTITILGSTVVTIDCAAPLPPNPAITVTDNCDPAPTLSGPVVTTVSLGCPGNRNVVRTWTARDRSGNQSQASQTIQVRDTHPPVMPASLTQLACLWPPDHGMVAIPTSSLSFSATDDCSLPITYRVVGATSSQCDDAPCASAPSENGDGNTTGDVSLSEDGSIVYLRAERAGTDPNGRTYMIMATATDACGNVSRPQPAGAVIVPHDQDEKSEVPCLSSH